VQRWALQLDEELAMVMAPMLVEELAVKLVYEWALEWVDELVLK
jgi:hypothetical protein